MLTVILGTFIINVDMISGEMKKRNEIKWESVLLDWALSLASASALATRLALIWHSHWR